MTQRTILVADDDASIRSLLQQLLADEGYAVLEAATGTEVVEQVSQANPDLVIMDVRMPELDGIEALQKVKGTAPKTSVLIMTAFGTSNAAIKAMELGAFDYVTKPFELEKISHTIKRAFEYQDLSAEVEVLRDAGGLQGRRQGREGRCHRSHHRRERHGQGARRRGAALLRIAPQRAAHQSVVRRTPGDAARGRAL